MIVEPSELIRQREKKRRRRPPPRRLIVIPARMESRRLPGKALVNIAGRSLLEWTVRAARRVPEASVVVTSPDREICREADRIGCPWMPSSPEHPTGTHRAAETVERSTLPAGSAVAVWQVDEPLIDPLDVAGMLDRIVHSPIKTGLIKTLVAEIGDREAENRSVVKAAVSRDRCWWFSRARLAGAMGHAGIYGFSVDALYDVASVPPSGLSEAEGLEQLTWIELGYEIEALSIPELPPAVNIPEDLERVREELIR